MSIRTLSLCIQLFIIGLSSCAPALDSVTLRSSELQDLEYDTRLHDLQELALRFPSKTFAGDTYGLLAGIAIQTQWQQKSFRSKLPFWFLLNASLTVQPYSYAQVFSSDQSPENLCKKNPDSQSQIPVSSFEVCLAWMKYFHYHESATLMLYKQGLYFDTQEEVLQAQLWQAHTGSLVYALWQNKAQFEALASQYPLEYQFWLGWINITFLLESLNFPTRVLLSKALSDIYMPPCILDEPNCAAILNQMQKDFVLLITREFLSIDAVITNYQDSQRDLVVYGLQGISDLTQK